MSSPIPPSPQDVVKAPVYRRFVVLVLMVQTDYGLDLRLAKGSVGGGSGLGNL